MSWGKLTSGETKPCPVTARHGALRIVRNAAGGLLAICDKCYVPASGRENLKGGN
jgi:hypothetical protein